MSPEGTTTDSLPTRATIWILYFLDPRSLEKKARACLNNNMEEYRNKVSDLHAIYSRSSVNLPVKLTRTNP